MRRPLCFLAVLAFAVAACNGEPFLDPTDDPAGEPAADVPQELAVGWIHDEYVQEGTGANVGMYPLNTNVYETLIRLTPEYELEPLLAQDWEFVEPNTWRFHLREDVTFHNGEPLDAEAVKEGLFDRVAADGGGTIRAGEDSVEIIDEHTLEFTPTEDNRRVPEQILHPNNSVVAPGTMPDGQEVVGTGPFRFLSYSSEEEISVERNPDYWGDAPPLESMTFRFYPEDSSRLLALEAGDIDLAFETPRDDVASLQDAGFAIAESEVGAYRALFVNIHGEQPYDLMQEEAVREAVALGIDRESIVNDVMDGLATTDQTLVPPHLLGDEADRVQGFDHDPDAAVELLEGAGWEEGPDGIRERDGRDLTLTLVSGFGGAEIHRPVPSVLQSQLAEIGIGLEIDERPDSAAYQEVIETGEADLYLEQGSQNDANVAFLPVLLFYTGGEGATAPYQSLFAPGEEFDRRIEPVITAVDPDEVRAATADALEYLIDDQAVVLPFAGIYRLVAHDPDVQGFTAHPSTLHTDWRDVSIGG